MLNCWRRTIKTTYHIKTLLLSSMTAKKESSFDEKLLLPPADVYGMKVLERDKFSKTVEIPCLSCPTDNLPNALKVLKKYLLKMANLNPVQPEEGTNNKRILLDPSKIKECFKTTEKDILESSGIREEDLKMQEITLTYENWLAEAILKSVLPSDQEGVSSWSVIGHIIHVNLREHLLDYKQLIGQVLLDKIKQARTIVNKANMIDTTYRTFQIELLAGENDMLTQVRENHCSFEFDFSKVYWYPRLGGEHERIVKELNYGDVLYDVFAGVGPFSVPAAKKGCRVLSNDLNPESFKWLQHNVKLNKVVDKVTVFNKDGADFICTEIKEDLRKRWVAGDFKDTHITMNLPAMAVEFLKNFKSLFSISEKPSNFKSPTVYVYCFIKNAEDSCKAAKELAEHHIGAELGEKDNLKIYFVRNVSSNKDMMRVSFRLPESILFDSCREEGEPAPKKPCLESSDVQIS